MVERIFISYRRDDSAGHAGRVFDRLKAEFGGDVLFMDVDAIPLGANFVRVLRDEVAKCSVLLAIIGPGWLDAKDADGERRLDNANDFVRVEIATALARDIPVIPILLEGARIPKPQALPPDLQELSQRNGLDVRHASFHADMDKLVRGLRAVPAQQPVPKPMAQPAPVAVSAPAVKPSIADLDIPILPDGTIGIMHEIDVPLVQVLLRPKVIQPVPTPDEVIAARGKWVKKFDVSEKSETPPAVFGHLFMQTFDIAMTSSDSSAPGTIFTGQDWHSGAVVWNILHGPSLRGWAMPSLGWLTYLGPTWRPEYADLSDAVFKKLGGKPLARFIKHP